MNSVKKTCIEVGQLLREDFSTAGYMNDHPYIIFYAKILDDGNAYESVSFHVEDLIGMNKYEILDRIYSYWL